MQKRLLWIIVAAMTFAPLAALAQPESQPVLKDVKPDVGDKPAVGEEKTATSSPASPSTKPTGVDGLFGGDKNFLFLMIGGMILLWFWMGRGRRKQAAKHKEMLNSLKKGNRITTIGGIIGTVVEVKDNEVTVKTDETNNVRMKFARWAIRDVGEPATGDTAPDDKK